MAILPPLLGSQCVLWLAICSASYWYVLYIILDRKYSFFASPHRSLLAYNFRNIIVKFYDASERSLCLTKLLALCCWSFFVLKSEDFFSTMKCHKFWWFLVMFVCVSGWVSIHSSLRFIKKNPTNIFSHFWVYSVDMYRIHSLSLLLFRFISYSY